MLHQCPCGGIVRCNGLFGSGATSILIVATRLVWVGRRHDLMPAFSRIDVAVLDLFGFPQKKIARQKHDKGSAKTSPEFWDERTEISAFE